MEAVADVRPHLVELWEQTERKETFVGNGGIGVLPDGRRVLLTAAHVVFKNYQKYDALFPPPESFRQRQIVVHGAPQTIGSLPEGLKFTQIDKRDMAMAPLQSGEGLPVAEKLPDDDTLTIQGSLRGEPFENTVRFRPREDDDSITAICLSANGPRNPTLNYTPVGDRLRHGMSGSVVLNADNQIVAISTHGADRTVPRGYNPEDFCSGENLTVAFDERG